MAHDVCLHLHFMRLRARESEAIFLVTSAPVFVAVHRQRVGRRTSNRRAQNQSSTDTIHMNIIKNLAIATILIACSSVISPRAESKRPTIRVVLRYLICRLGSPRWAKVWLK